MLCGQLRGELQDFVNLARAEHTADALRVDDRERSADQVSLLYLLALDEEFLQQVEELQLTDGKNSVSPDELVKRSADLVGLPAIGVVFLALLVAQEVGEIHHVL